jgi:hypothetical protein
MRLGVDFSQWGGPLERETIRCWKQQGVDHAVVQYSERMNQHLEALLIEGGIETEGYVYLYWGQSQWNQTPQQRTNLALDLAGSRITRLWLDAEDTTNPFQEEQLLECVSICNNRGMPTGIYTGKWWWDGYAKGSTAFSHLPLWDAYYLATSSTPNMNVRPQSMAGFRPYGGWTKPTIWQWHNTTFLCGHSVDLNVIGSSVVTPAPIGDDDLLTRHNWIASWFDDRALPNSGDGFYIMQAQADFSLPDNAREVTFAVWMNSGETAWFDGQSAKEAGRVGARGVNYGTVTAILADPRQGSDDRGKTINFQSVGDSIIGRVMCLGYK